MKFKHKDFTLDKISMFDMNHYTFLLKEGKSEEICFVYKPGKRFKIYKDSIDYPDQFCVALEVKQNNEWISEGLIHGLKM